LPIKTTSGYDAMHMGWKLSCCPQVCSTIVTAIGTLDKHPMIDYNGLEAASRSLNNAFRLRIISGFNSCAGKPNDNKA
jgi:hypothetical protein